MSNTVAGTADPPTMNRWVITAATIVGMSRSAPNAAQDGTSSATAETTSTEPVTYRNHCPMPIASNNATNWARRPASVRRRT